jgi:hypothetical protein
MMRCPILAILASLLSIEVAAQDPPRPPADTAEFARLFRAGTLQGPALSMSGVRVRASDGRYLVWRNSIVWLADSAHAFQDSTRFHVEIAPTGGLLVRRSMGGECLTAHPRERFMPLTFGTCADTRLLMFPRPANEGGIRSGFWLLSVLGVVGPGSRGSLLMPTSSTPVWFTLVPK